jgi:hypothetical protein
VGPSPEQCALKIIYEFFFDGMAHSFTCPIHDHDASVLYSSAMFLMLSNAYIDGDQNQPAKQ